MASSAGDTDAKGRKRARSSSPYVDADGGGSASGAKLDVEWDDTLLGAR
jgi:hypothetical protein